MNLVLWRPGKGATLPVESGRWLLGEVALPEKGVQQAGGKDGEAEGVKGVTDLGNRAESQAAVGA